MVERTTFRSVKFPWRDIWDQVDYLNSLQAKRLIRVRPCVPEHTDTNNWSEVFYEAWA